MSSDPGAASPVVSPVGGAVDAGRKIAAVKAAIPRCWCRRGGLMGRLIGSTGVGGK